MLDTATAKTNLLSLLNDLAADTGPGALSREQLADVLIDVIADLLRSATVTGTAKVNTTGTAAAQTGTALLTDGKIQ